MGFLGALLTDAALSLADSLLSEDDSSSTYSFETEDLTKDLFMCFADFVIGYRCEITKDVRRAVAAFVRNTFNDETVSAFSLEHVFSLADLMSKEKVDAALSKFLVPPKERHNCQLIFLYNFILVAGLEEHGLGKPQYVYNLYKLKNYLKFSRVELNEIYLEMSKLMETDIDDVADAVEQMFSEESIKKILQDNSGVGEKSVKLIEGTKNDADTLSALELTELFLFIAGYHSSVSKSVKKGIISYLKENKDENASLFLMEDKMDSFIASMQEKKSSEVFSSCFSFQITREKGVAMLYFSHMIKDYIVEKKIECSSYSQVIYNLYLIQKNLNFDKTELVQVYSKLADYYESDIDTVAESVESLIGEDEIKKLLDDNPEAGEYGDGREIKIAEEKNDAVQSPAEILETIRNAFHSFIQDKNDIKKSLYFLDENSKVLNNALKSYAGGCAGENAVIQWDASIFLHNGKIGFLLTNKNVYFRNTTSKPDVIPLSEIKEFSWLSMNCTYYLVANGKNLECFTTDKDGTKQICEFLNEILPLIKQL